MVANLDPALLGSFLPGCPFYSGLYYSAVGITGVSTGTTSQGFLQGFRLVAGRSCTLNSIGIEVVTAGSTGAVLRLAVYKLTMGASPTGALLVDAGTVDGTTTGVKTLTISAAVTAGDLLFVAAAQQGTPTTVPVVRQNDGVDPQIGSTSATMAAARILGLSQSGVTGAAPSTVTLAVAGSTPRVILSAA